MNFLKKTTLALAAFGICYGILFRTQHYPGSSVLLLSGSCLLVSNVIMNLVKPSSIGNVFHVFKNDYSRLLQIVQGLGFAIIILAALFRIQHYPVASILHLLGWNMVTVNLIIRAFSKKQDKRGVDISDFGKDKQK